MTTEARSATASTDDSVFTRYSAAAQQVETALCCPVSYAGDYLSLIPQEIIEKDYGCGDPTPFVRPGDTVVDLGSGAGKLCYILAQIVGPEGRVIGVDCNPEMLALSRKYLPVMSERVGVANVEFRCGRIQDLSLDLERYATWLTGHAIRTPQDVLAADAHRERLRTEHPLIASNSVDCVVSNCVLNLVRSQDRTQLFSEIFRVLRRGGRVAISDIVSDEDVPEHLQRNGTLWSGCISGAFREDRFLQAFEEAGFHGIELVRRQREPWQTVEGIEFRSVTVVAYKGKEGPCWERKQAVLYRGPFKQVADDDGHSYRRGERVAVCDKTYQLLQREPYQGLFEAIEPYTEIPLEEASSFDCRRSVKRDPRETKGADYNVTTESLGPCCGEGGTCC